MDETRLEIHSRPPAQLFGMRLAALLVLAAASAANGLYFHVTAVRRAARGALWRGGR